MKSRKGELLSGWEAQWGGIELLDEKNNWNWRTVDFWSRREDENWRRICGGEEDGWIESRPLLLPQELGGVLVRIYLYSKDKTEFQVKLWTCYLKYQLEEARLPEDEVELEIQFNKNHSFRHKFSIQRFGPFATPDTFFIPLENLRGEKLPNIRVSFS